MLVVLVFILGIGYFFYGLQPTFSSSNPVKVVIEKGDGFKKISADLSSKGLVRSIVVFKLYAFLTGSATKIQPGIYELASTMSVPEIVGFLISGGKSDVTVQIIEGATLKDIDEMLQKAEVLKNGSVASFNFQNLKERYKFLANVNSLEGFLFPDTYNFRISSNVEDVVIKMLDNFEMKAWPLLATEQRWYEKLILASYLEKEVKEYEEMQKAAGILLKRLKLKMPLQVDATLSYAKCDGKFLTCSDPKVYGEDKKIESAFNTYKYNFLTPTPISNPGEKALKAVIDFKDTDYLYYCTREGKALFSKTLAEHNKKCF